MSTFTRTDNSLLARWWWTVDRWTLAALLTLIVLGALLALAATPPVAERLGYDTFHFVKRQFVFLPGVIVIMLAISTLPPATIHRLAWVTFVVFFLLTFATLFVGSSVKGAARWIRLGPLSIQPSEFIKPAFAVVAAGLFAQWRMGHLRNGWMFALGLFAAVLAVLLRQPDFGMAMVVLAVFGVQFFLAGLPLLLVVGMVAVCGGVGVGAYFMLDHVRSRVNRFLDPQSGDTYQITRSLEAFTNGGLFGTGPGEGKVKAVLPDAHADFVFAVAGEEFGLIACLIIVGLFAFIVLRGFARMLQESDLFVLLATTGLLVQFGLQAFINMASTLHLIPTKGMTLPFISYGGSSLLALAFGMGMVLGLSRQRPGENP